MGEGSGVPGMGVSGIDAGADAPRVEGDPGGEGRGEGTSEMNIEGEDVVGVDAFAFEQGGEAREQGSVGDDRLSCGTEAAADERSS